MAPYLRSAGGDHQLREQLWTSSISGEVDSSGDSMCARTQTDPGVRRRDASSRLALRGRPLRSGLGSARAGRNGETYCIGSNSEWPNIRIVELICDLVDELRPELGGDSRRLITHVADRPGHDRRYAIDARKMERELRWKPSRGIQAGIHETVRWYVDNQEWVDACGINGSRSGAGK